MKFELPKLPYSYDALEPYIDAKTMEIHYTKHHQAYCDNLNKALENYADLKNPTAEDLLRNLTKLKVSNEDKEKIRNHGGGFVNHNIYWSIMGPIKNENYNLIMEIEQTFDSLDKFKEEFSNNAKKHFGSGWTWLARDTENKLKVYSLPNQDSPLSLQHTPIMGLDLWEHAYYLKYQNRRADYIEAWWKTVAILPN